MKAPLDAYFSSKGSLKLSHPFVSLFSRPCLRMPKSTSGYNWFNSTLSKLANNSVTTRCWVIFTSCYVYRFSMFQHPKRSWTLYHCFGLRISLPNCYTVRAEPHWAVWHFFVGRPLMANQRCSKPKSFLFVISQAEIQETLDFQKEIDTYWNSKLISVCWPLHKNAAPSAYTLHGGVGLPRSVEPAEVWCCFWHGLTCSNHVWSITLI